MSDYFVSPDDVQAILGDVLRHRLFWLAVPALLGPPAFGTAFFFFQVHLAEIKGWAHLHLVAIFPVYTVTSVAATLGSGWIIDRVGTSRLMPFFLLPMAVGFLVLGGAQGLWAAALSLALLAVTHGARVTLFAAFWAEYYGTRHIGAIKAMAAAVMVLGTAIGPGLCGLLIDAGVGFPQQMPGIALFFVVAAGMLWAGVVGARPRLAAPQPDVVGP